MDNNKLIHNIQTNPVLKREAEAALIHHYENEMPRFRQLCDPVMAIIITMMQHAKEEESEIIAAYLCCEIIGGFEVRKQQLAVLKSVQQTIEDPLFFTESHPPTQDKNNPYK